MYNKYLCVQKTLYKSVTLTELQKSYQRNSRSLTWWYIFSQFSLSEPQLLTVDAFLSRYTLICSSSSRFTCSKALTLSIYSTRQPFKDSKLGALPLSKPWDTGTGGPELRNPCIKTLLMPRARRDTRVPRLLTPPVGTLPTYTPGGLGRLLALPMLTLRLETPEQSAEDKGGCCPKIDDLRLGKGIAAGRSHHTVPALRNSGFPSLRYIVLFFLPFWDYILSYAFLECGVCTICRGEFCVIVQKHPLAQQFISWIICVL